MLAARKLAGGKRREDADDGAQRPNTTLPQAEDIYVFSALTIPFALR